MQVTMVIDMNEEVEKSSGPAKLTDEVMGIMCRWFWRTIILVRSRIVVISARISKIMVILKSGTCLIEIMVMAMNMMKWEWEHGNLVMLLTVMLKKLILYKSDYFRCVSPIYEIWLDLI